MNNFDNQSRDYQQVAKAIAYISEHVHEQPGLAQIAEQVHVSEQHFQKVFSRWAGVSPKRFLQYLTKEHVKGILNSASVEEAAFAVGLSTKSRIHDLMIHCEGMTPGEYQRQGRDLEIRYGFHPTPFGDCLIAVTSRGICKLAFSQDNRDAIEQELHQEWQLATRVADQRGTAAHVQQIFALAEQKSPLHLLLKGTNFQIKVWEALVQLPLGQLTTYQRIASHINNPEGIRAVGTAVGKNPVAFLIPCHRVIRKTGEIHQYRWGSSRKRAIIGWEQARRESC